MKKNKVILTVLGLILVMGCVATVYTGCSWFEDKNEAKEEAAAQAEAKDNTPLHKAIIDGKLDEAKKLIEDGADVNAANENGETPLHTAVILENKEAVQVLIDNGADTEAKTNDDKTALAIAEEKQLDDVAALLEPEEPAEPTDEQ